ncbi:uncharacterized protein LOC132723097 [Ruditapes philippinarum]|uniref:uncharacterized protein LOC132723097 n=1 Tax=Ruditapes philippinarum TaxID=129788 RepID=UPI00295BE2E2|nr:uncharacterized protein LOC132723097 [Ruditapes philippinarum]
MTVVKSDATITPIEITMRPLIENTTRTQITVDTTNAVSIEGQTDSSSNEQTVKPLVRSTELLPKLQDTKNNINSEVTASNQLTESSSTVPSVTVDTSSTTLSDQSRQPFVTGNIVTSTSTPKSSTSSLSLVDLLNAISKLENITSDELIDAISPASNSNNSNIFDSSANASATVHEDKTKNTTPSQKINNNSESTGTTESLQSSKQQTTEANMMTDSTTDLIVNPDMLFNIVTSRTTRISQPQGGRFGGGMSIAKITPVDNIVNIDLNIPGGEANVEKERNKIDGGS